MIFQNIINHFSCQHKPCHRRYKHHTSRHRLAFGGYCRLYRLCLRIKHRNPLTSKSAFSLKLSSAKITLKLSSSSSLSMTSPCGYTALINLFISSHSVKSSNGYLSSCAHCIIITPLILLCLILRRHSFFTQKFGDKPALGQIYSPAKRKAIRGLPSSI